ncbi:MAG: hypothetical protein NDI90_14205 [Nitrospira sp. BO4]|jgi:hypothetical protein|nr:hypothetical protein [Nitrospira sp. BO4]
MSLLRLSMLVVALTGAVGLAWSNPTMDDYLPGVSCSAEYRKTQLVVS